jgi:uncharacterized repeat protein (TIGR03847 family)
MRVLLLIRDLILRSEALVMPDQQLDMDPVERLAVGAVGRPGNRTFYLQAGDAQRTVTLKLEKEQVLGLSRAISELFVEMETREVLLAASVLEPPLAELAEPLEPLFAVGAISIGHDAERQRLVLFLLEFPQGEEAGEGQEEQAVVRLWLAPGQLRALGRQAGEVAAKGRATCTLCGRPMDPDGHLCPRRNGHGKKVSED